MQGKVIALTGGASGIGLATAQLLSSRGAIVCIADIDQHALDAATEYFTAAKVEFAVQILDVTKRADVDSWIESIVQKYGKLDGAANCAGIIGKAHGLTKITELEDDEWDRIMSVNLSGLMYCLRAELRKIENGGSIVNISSIQGVMGKRGVYLQKPGLS
jgi:NAD(P)-dependent dehydrogenase (short-subunit alcohol dehydrogenase family)